MKTKFFIWLCAKLPKTLIYYCANQLVVYGTVDKYSGQIVPELTAMDALKRYADDHNCY